MSVLSDIILEELVAAAARIEARLAGLLGTGGVAPPAGARKRLPVVAGHVQPPAAPTLPRGRGGLRMTTGEQAEMQAAILGLFRPGLLLANGDVRRRLPAYERHQVTTGLKALVKRRALRCEGSGPTTSYQLPKSR